MDEPIQLPIDGVLDLHTFKPSEIKDLVPDYLAACRERGIFQMRIIHGKGIGNLKRTVHSILAKHPEVISFTLDHENKHFPPVDFALQIGWIRFQCESIPSAVPSGNLTAFGLIRAASFGHDQMIGEIAVARRGTKVQPAIDSAECQAIG